MNRSNPTRVGFTLIELLVVIAIITVLAAMLMPVLSKARLSARLTVVHSDLRQVELAIEMYVQDRPFEAVQFPPARFGCSLGSRHGHMPPELTEKGYLESMRPDPFDENGHTYRYDHPGWGYGNGLVPSIRSLWVPDAFPDDDGSGRTWSDERASPVKAAVWSVGPGGTLALPYVNYDILHYPVRPSHWYPAEPEITWYDASWTAHTETRPGIVCHVRTDKGWLRSGMWSTER